MYRDIDHDNVALVLVRTEYSVLGSMLSHDTCLLIMDTIVIVILRTQIYQYLKADKRWDWPIIDL